MVDYQGQKFGDTLIHIVFALICIPGWIYGYMHDDFMPTLYSWGFAVALIFIVSLDSNEYNDMILIAVCTNSWLCRIGHTLTATQLNGKNHSSKHKRQIDPAPSPVLHFNYVLCCVVSSRLK